MKDYFKALLDGMLKGCMAATMVIIGMGNIALGILFAVGKRLKIDIED